MSEGVAKETARSWAPETLPGSGVFAPSFPLQPPPTSLGSRSDLLPLQSTGPNLRRIFAHVFLSTPETDWHFHKATYSVMRQTKRK